MVLSERQGSHPLMEWAGPMAFVARLTSGLAPTETRRDVLVEGLGAASRLAARARPGGSLGTRHVVMSGPEVVIMVSVGVSGWWAET